MPVSQAAMGEAFQNIKSTLLIGIRGSINWMQITMVPINMTGQEKALKFIFRESWNSNYRRDG